MSVGVIAATLSQMFDGVCMVGRRALKKLYGGFFVPCFSVAAMHDFLTRRFGHVNREVRWVAPTGEHRV